MFVSPVYDMIQFIGRHYASERDGYRLSQNEGNQVNEHQRGMSDYLSVMKVMLRSPMLLIDISGIYILFNFQDNCGRDDFTFHIYENRDTLQLGSGLISVFPAFSSVIMLMLCADSCPGLTRPQVNRTVVWGFIISFCPCYSRHCSKKVT